jgi:hypothetical protein
VSNFLFFISRNGFELGQSQFEYLRISKIKKNISLQAGFIYLFIYLFFPNSVRVARSTGHLSRRGLLPNLATSQRKKEKISKILAHTLRAMV